MKKIGITQKNIVLITVLIFITAISTSLLTGYHLYGEIIQKNEEEIIKDVEFISNHITNYKEILLEDLKYLGKMATLREYVNVHSGKRLTTEKKNSEQNKYAKRLTDDFIHFASAKQFYLQIKLIGIADGGRELVRIEKKTDNDEVISVPMQQLQNKDKTILFIKTVQPPPDKIYVSDIELNVEYDKVQIPYQPVIRAIMPVYTNDDKELFGVLVIKIDAFSIFQPFHRMLKNGRNIYIKGYSNNYKLLLNPDKYFRVEFQPYIQLTKIFPGITKKINESKSDYGLLHNQGIDNSTIVGYKNVYFDQLSPQSIFTIFITAPNYFIAAPAMKSVKLTILKALTLLPLFLLIGFYLIFEITRPIKQIAHSAESFIKKGIPQDLPVNDKSEIGILARAFESLTVQLKQHMTLHETSKLHEQNILNNILDGVITINEKGIIQTFNPAAEQIFYYMADEIIGENVNILMPEPYSSEYDNYIQNYLTTGQAKIIGISREVSGKRKDGTIFPMVLAVTVIEIDDHKIFTGIIRDITVQKETEKELIEAKEEAEEASRAKARILAKMSHELRTPLNAIIGYSEMLKEDVATSDHNELFSDLVKINDAGKHLLDMISDVLDISKIEAGRMTLIVDEFNIADLVETVKSTCLPLVKEKGNTLTIQLAENIDNMQNDPMRLRQCLLNLLSNAAKFTEEGEIKLLVNCKVDNDIEWIQFQVVDTGIGINAEKLEIIFDAFTQAELNTTYKFGGTGLGLSITRNLAEIMGGSIKVESQIGKGTTFTLLVPRHSELDTNQKTFEPREIKVDKAKIYSNKGECVVLIIDDQVSSREILTRYLSKAGYRVITAANGEEGLELAREHHPVAITLDVLMENMDGWHVLEVLKSDQNLRNIPVIMCTIVDDHNRGFALGATEFLIKPIDRDRLIQVLSRFCISPCHVLIVEDDQNTRNLFSRTLSTLGWNTIEAGNGREGLSRLSEQLPDVILLDLMMPEMDGFEFIVELQKNNEWLSIPVIVLTAKELDTEDHERLNGYVQMIVDKKIYKESELLDVILQQLTCIINSENKKVYRA